MSNFWQQLNKPIFCLAPMEEVTDFAFREMFARYSGEQGVRVKGKGESKNNFVMFTEFVNVDGLLHPEGRKKLEIDLKYSENQRPIVAQLWGSNPEKFRQAARLVAELGFDGVDINMGCPQSKEIQAGACAALIREPALAREIIAATKEGWLSQKAAFKELPEGGLLGETAGVPVSVKTRIGYSKPEEMEGWVKNLLQMDIAVLTLHGRTKKEMSKVPAHWDKIAEAVKLRDEFQKNKTEHTLIIGNGDVKDCADGLAKIEAAGCDGAMIGRGAFGNPWLFREDGYQPDIKERLTAMIEHAELFERTFSGKKSFFIMRKHFKAYASGFPGSHELRAKLMEARSLEETKSIVAEYLGEKK